MKLDELRKRLRVPIHTIASEGAPAANANALTKLVTDYLAGQAKVDDEHRARGWPDCGICRRPFSPHSVDENDRSGICCVCQRKHRGMLSL